MRPERNGVARGALDGDYPGNLALGTPLLSGWHDEDEFDSDTLGWSIDLTGATGTANALLPTSTSDHEHGLRLLQVTSSGDRIAIYRANATKPWRRYPPNGARWVCKLRHNTSTTNSRVWAGYCSALTAPVAGGALHFLGAFRDTTGNWIGRVMAAGTATDTDLGISATTSATAYRLPAFRNIGGEIQWYTVNASDPRGDVWTAVGSPVSTNLPTTALGPVIGIESTAAGTKGLVVDLWSCGGRSRRS